jgi:RecA/RadA recombinase
VIFTFYSYKGGVGRSMAMAGVAYLLAQRNLRVLAIDFDLEAPGLERYFFDRERCREVRAQPGLLDLIRSYREALGSEAAFAAGTFKRWQDFRLTAIHTAGRAGGSVDLMTAGRREPEAAMRDYALTVRSFDWQDFFVNWKGDLFFDWLRRQFTARDGGYDVVLVDSRTGVTEMGGVCAYQLADAAVLLCAPNDQNLEGTRDVARDFRSEGVRALRRGRPLEILALPARLAPEHPQRADFLARFAETMGVEGMPAALAAAGLDYASLALPYLPAFAIAERLVGDPAAAGGGEAPPIEVFERLADALTLLAPPDGALGRQQAQALRRLRGDAAPTDATLIADPTRASAGYDAFVDHAPDDGEAAAQLVDALQAAGLRAVAEPSVADELARGGSPRALAQALDYSQALLVCFGRPAHAETRARLIARARRRHDVAIVPVLLPGADPQALASFDLAPQDALDLGDWPAPQARHRLLARLRATGRRPDATTGAPSGRPPYPGAAAYDEDDAASFCGREDEVDALLQALARHDVVELVGPAQSGKTSLLMAGVLPRLRRGGIDGLPRLVATTVIDHAVDGPWPDPSDLGPPAADALRLLIVESADSFAVDTQGDGRGDGEGDRAARMGPQADLAREQGRVQAVAEALATLRASPGAKAVVVARDVWSPPAREAWRAVLAAHRAGRVELAPMDGTALRRAIEEPARRAGHLLEPGLSERLVESAGGAANAIAQIQLALAALWPRRTRGWLTNSALDAAGHLGGIVGARRRTVLDGLPAPRRAAAQALFARLVMLSRFDELVGAPQPWAALASIPLIAHAGALGLRDRLAAAALIDLARVEGAGDGPDDAVQVALARPDPGVYFADDAQALDMRLLLWLPTLGTLVRHWRLAGAEDTLLRGSALAEAQGWRESCVELLTAPETAYIDASVAAEARRADEAQRRREARERERLAAAEALAAEQAARARTEAGSAERARQDAARLRRGRKRLVAMLAIAGVATAAAGWQTLNEREARRQAQDALAAEAQARAYAQEQAQRAEAEKQSAIDGAAALEASLQAQTALVASALAARQAAEAALAAHDSNTRTQAARQLQSAEDQFRAATAKASDAQRDCPFGRRIYLHIGNEAERDAARGLIPLLERQGFIVPGVERVAQVPRASELRYFRDEVVERRGAELAASALSEATRRPVPARRVAGVDTSGLRPCHYEAWFAAGTLARSEPTRGATAKN